MKTRERREAMERTASPSTRKQTKKEDKEAVGLYNATRNRVGRASYSHVSIPYIWHAVINIMIGISQIGYAPNHLHSAHLLQPSTSPFVRALSPHESRLLMRAHKYHQNAGRTIPSSSSSSYLKGPQAHVGGFRDDGDVPGLLPQRELHKHVADRGRQNEEKEVGERLLNPNRRGRLPHQT